MIMKIIKYVFGGFFLLIVLAVVFGSGGGAAIANALPQLL